MEKLTLKNLRPLADRVLLKEIPVESKTKGGIIIPDTVKDKPVKGEIIKVGGVTDESLIPGNIVLYGKYGGTPIEIEDEQYVMLRESELFACFEIVKPVKKKK